MTRLCISCCTCCEESNNKLVFHKTFDCFIPRFYSTKIMSVSARHFVCEISGSHTSAAEDSSLLGCYGVSLCSHQHFEGTTILQNAGSQLPNDTSSHPRRPESSDTFFISCGSKKFYLCCCSSHHEIPINVQYQPNKSTPYVMYRHCAVFNSTSYNECAGT